MAQARQFDTLNPAVETPQATETIRYSQGAQPDQTLGTLFSGVADMVQAGVKAADQYFRTAIREEVEGPVDEITSQFTGRGPTPAGGGLDSTAPDEVVRTGERLTRLTQGVRAGTILNSHYWGLLDMEARRLRAKYPGYRDHIDNVFQDMTGSVPANALRRSLMEEANSRRGEDPEKIRRHWEEIVIKQTPFGPEVAARNAAGNPHTTQELQALAASHFSVQTNLEARRRSLEVQQATGQANRHNVMNTASDAIWADINNAWRGTDYNRLMELVRQSNARIGETGGQLSTQEQAQITQAFAQLRSSLNQAVELRITEYGRLGLHVDDANSIRRNVEHTLKNLEEDVNKGRTSLMAMYKSIAEGIGNADQVSLLSANEQFRRVNALRQVVGPDALNQILLQNPNLTRDVFQSNVLSLSQILAPDAAPVDGRAPPPPPTLTDIHRQNEANGLTAPQAYAATRRALLSALQDQNSTPQAIQRASEALYGERNAQYLDLFPRGNVRNQVFQEMASPAVTKRMQELRDQGNTQAWNAYSNWVTTNANALALQPSQDLIRALGDPNSRLTINFNPQSNQLEVGRTASQGPRGSGSMGSADFWLATPSRYAGAAQAWVQQLNAALLPMGALGQAAAKEGETPRLVEEILEVHGLKIVPDPANPNQMIVRPLREGQSPTNPSGRSNLGGPDPRDVDEAETLANEGRRRPGEQNLTGRSNVGADPASRMWLRSPDGMVLAPFYPEDASSLQRLEEGWKLEMLTVTPRYTPIPSKEMRGNNDGKETQSQD